MRLGLGHRQNFKKPFGLLIKQDDVSRDGIMQSIRDVAKVVSVGDATTRRLVRYGIIPDLAVIDGKERRAPSRLPDYPALEIYCSNPAGMITAGAVRAIRNGLNGARARLVVNGEEDLLVLPACAYSPLQSVIFYGQPLEGLVIVRITAEKKAEARHLLKEMALGKEAGKRGRTKRARTQANSRLEK